MSKEKMKITHFKNISRFCTTGVPPTGSQADAIQLHGRPFYFPPGKVIHDENGIMFPLIQQTGTRYFVACDKESEILELKVPEALRVPGGFMGINFIAKALTDEELTAEKDRATMSKAEYESLRETASAGARAMAELVAANALIDKLKSDLQVASAVGGDQKKMAAINEEAAELKRHNEALRMDVIRVTAERDRAVKASSSRSSRL